MRQVTILLFVCIYLTGCKDKIDPCMGVQCGDNQTCVNGLCACADTASWNLGSYCYPKKGGYYFINPPEGFCAFYSNSTCGCFDTSVIYIDTVHYNIPVTTGMYFFSRKIKNELATLYFYPTPRGDSLVYYPEFNFGYVFFKQPCIVNGTNVRSGWYGRFNARKDTFTVKIKWFARSSADIPIDSCVKVFTR